MTGKQRRLVSAIRDGLPIAEAAAAAGYTQDYARRLVEEPAIRAAIDAPDPEPAPQQAAARAVGMQQDPSDMLRSIINDADQDTRVRITATRALAMVERDRRPDGGPPMLITLTPRDPARCMVCPGCLLQKWRQERGQNGQVD